MGIGKWFEERIGIQSILSFFQKKEIPQHKHSFWYYTGSSILLFFSIQIVTGILLAMYYKPTLETANSSLNYIIHGVPLGWVIRSIHSWSATFMIIFVFIHLLSIWILKSYRKPRELTWMSGVFLLITSLAFGFTGYLLPWDDLSLSATKVGTDIPGAIPVIGVWFTKLMRGGADVTGETLTRFFTVHICILPLFIIAILAFHLFLIQKQGIGLPHKLENQKKEIKSLPFWPNFIYREAMVWIVLIGALFTLALLLPPHLGQQADLLSPAPIGIRPEWYFLFLFQTLKIFPANILFIKGETIAVLLIGFSLFLFFIIPLIDNKPQSKKGKFITLCAYLFILYSVIMSVWSLL